MWNSPPYNHVSKTPPPFCSFSIEIDQPDQTPFLSTPPSSEVQLRRSQRHMNTTTNKNKTVSTAKKELVELEVTCPPYTEQHQLEMPQRANKVVDVEVKGYSN